MHIQIHKQDHNQLAQEDDEDGSRHLQRNLEDDFEICTKACVAADFVSESEFNQHMLRHVRTLRVRLARLNLDDYKRLSNGTNNYRLIKKPCPAALGRQERILVDALRVELTNYTCLSEDCVYDVVQHEVNLNYLIPEIHLLMPGFGRCGGGGHTDHNYVRVSGGNDVCDDRVLVVQSPATVVLPQFSKQRRRRRHPMTLQDLATSCGSPANYCEDVLRSFGSSHFMVGPRMPSYVQRPMAPLKPQTGAACAVSSQNLVQKGQFGIPPTIGALSAPSTYGPLCRPVVRSTAGACVISGSCSRVDAHKTSGIHTTSVGNPTRGIRPTFEAVSTSFMRVSAPSNQMPMTVQNEAFTFQLSDVLSKMGNEFRGSTGNHSVKGVEPAMVHPTVQTLIGRSTHKQDASSSGGAIVTKRIPLSVRQPPFANVIDRRPKNNATVSPVFVSVGQDLPSPSPPKSSTSEVIDLLSDDENDGCQEDNIHDINNETTNNDVVEIIELD